MNYSVWIRELTKYKGIIDLAKHMLFEKDAGRRTDYLLPQLQKAIDDCELTTIRIAGNDRRPLAAAESMFQNNLASNLIQGAIDAAERHFSDLLQQIQKAAAGKYSHPLSNFVEAAKVHDAFRDMGARIVADYLILGLTVHLFDRDKATFERLRDWLQANIA